MNLKEQAKSLLAQGISILRQSHSVPRVIYYHSIHPTWPRSMSPYVFQQQIEWLQAHGYHFLTFAELVEQSIAGVTPNRCVSITFDDGYIDNYEYALPILLSVRARATFFVVSGVIAEVPLDTYGQKALHAGKKMMARAHLREIASLGMEVGSHTRSHIHVKNELRRSVERAWSEVAGSREELEHMIGAQVVSFAYPNGQRGVFDADTRALLQEAGYKYAATTIWGHLDQRCDPFEVPRVLIRYNDSLEIFVNKMNGLYDFMRWFHLIRDGSKSWARGRGYN